MAQCARPRPTGEAERSRSGFKSIPSRIDPLHVYTVKGYERQECWEVGALASSPVACRPPPTVPSFPGTAGT